MQIYDGVFTAYSVDIDDKLTMKPSAMLRTMQEAANHHLEENGILFVEQRERSMGFLLIRLALEIGESLGYFDRYHVKTWHKGNHGPLWKRDSLIEKDGKVIARASSEWVLVDLANHKILRPSALPFNIGGITIAKDSGTEVTIGKTPPEGLAFTGEREIRYSDIDVNRHVNNAVYADIVCDFLPAEFASRPVRRMELYFANEALRGEKLSVYTKAGDGRVATVGKVGERVSFLAETEF